MSDRQIQITYTGKDASASATALGVAASLQGVGTAAQKAAIATDALPRSLTAVNTLFKEFSGANAAKAADEMAAALGRVGDVSKLSTDQLAHANSVLSAGIETNKRYGIEVPQYWQKYSAEIKAAEQSTGLFGGSLSNLTAKAGHAFDDWLGDSTKMLTGFASAFALEKVVEFTHSIFESAASIEDNAEKLGVSAEAFQRWTYAATQAGATADDIVTTVSFMNKTLGEGSKQTQAALETLGLSFETIRQEGSEKAFGDITSAIMRIEDPMTRARVAVELFGRSAASILPAIAKDIKKVGDQASVMNNETVEGLAEAEKQWKKWEVSATTALANTLGGIQKYGKYFTEEGVLSLFAGPATAKGAGKDIDLPLQKLGAALDAGRPKVDAFAKSVDALVDELSGAKLGRAIEENSAALAKATNLHALSDFQIQKELKTLREYAAEGGQLTDLQKQFIDVNEHTVASFVDLSAGQAFLTDQIATHGIPITQSYGEAIYEADQHSILFGTHLLATAQSLKNLPGTNALPQMLENNKQLIKGLDAETRAWQQTWGSLEHAVSDDFAKMLTGAESFKDGFVSVWHDIENEVTSILSNLLRKFVDGFLRGVVGSMQGQQGAFSQTFSGILSGYGSGATSHGAYGGLNIGSSGSTSFLKGGSGSGLSFGGGTAAQTASGALLGAGVGISVGYGVGGATGSTPKGALAGAGAGAAAGLAFGGPIGAGVGALAGAIAGYVGALKAHEKANDDRDAFIADALKQYGPGNYSGYTGGMGAVGQKLAAAGRADLFQQLIDANTGPKAQAAIAAITDVLQQQQAVIDNLKAGYGDLESQATSMGATIPADFDAIETALLKAGDTKDAQEGYTQLTAAVQKYQGVLSERSAFDQAKSEMQSLGLTADDMNGKFHQMADEETAEQIAQTWKDLAPYVSDVNVLADKYLDQANQMVKDSETMGVKVPDSMKPIIENLIAQGKLLDANGDKITDLGQIDFEEDPLAKGLDDLNLTLQDIRDLLEKDLPHAAQTFAGAARTAAGDANDAFRTVAVPRFDSHNAPAPDDNSGQGADLGDIPVMDSPIKYVKRPGLVYTNPGDIVGMPHLTPGFGAPAAPTDVHVHFHLDGAVISGDDAIDRLASQLQPAIHEGLIEAMRYNRNTMRTRTQQALDV